MSNLLTHPLYIFISLIVLFSIYFLVYCASELLASLFISTNIGMAFFPRPNEYEVAEITWENGQLAMHGHGRASDTLESIVHQATTCYHQSQNQYIDQQKSQNQPRTGDIASSSGNLGDPSYVKKRPRLSHDECGRNFENFNEDTSINSKDNDTTMMTWPSFDSPNQSLKSKNTDDDSACQYLSENQEEECKTEGETVRSRSSRRSRSAAIHNQSERRRREKINQKMKALQKLVPNANKMDKASMLDEVIDYLKKLQAQVKLMNNMPIASPSPPQMMMIPMPLQLQQQHHHHQMSMLARMRMMGMAGILPSPHHPIMVPQTTAGPAHVAATSQPLPATNTGTAPFGDSYTAFLAQSMNMDIYNNMAALFQRQVNQVAKSTVNTSHQDK